MSTDFQFDVETRTDLGKGASRRLRRSGRVPAVLYGAGKEPVSLSLHHNEAIKQLENEAVYSSILTLKLDGREEKAVLRDLQRHPFKPTLLHMDFLRVSEDSEIRVLVPLHFVNEDQCVGVRQQGGAISHLLNETEITCLPKDLPEFIEVDVASLELGATLHLSDISLPEGVTFTALSHDNDAAVANVHHTGGGSDDDEDADDEAGEEGDV